MFLASDFGRITVKTDKTADIQLRYLCGEDRELKIKSIDAKIVGHLRYEYALNLIQKLGIEFTRIGLDFVVPTE
ncbi:hypothetical protein CFFPNG_02060 [Methylorubrum aminovorans]